MLDARYSLLYEVVMNSFCLINRKLISDEQKHPSCAPFPFIEEAELPPNIDLANEPCGNSRGYEYLCRSTNPNEGEVVNGLASDFPSTCR